MQVALTFDDGPSEWTEDLLAVLGEHEARATFFVCGNAIPGREKILHRIKRRGHEIGNHTMSHPNLQAIGKDEVFHELADCSNLIFETVGVVPRLYRPPFLKDSMVARAVGEACGMESVGCDVVPGDWANADPWRIARESVLDTSEGAVILLHDGRPLNQPPFEEGGSLDSRKHTVQATARLVPELQARGYEFVTVSELLFAAV